MPRAVEAQKKAGELAGIGFRLAIEDAQAVIAAHGEVTDVFTVGRELCGRERIKRRPRLIIHDRPRLAIGRRDIRKSPAIGRQARAVYAPPLRSKRAGQM